MIQKNKDLCESTGTERFIRDVRMMRLSGQSVQLDWQLNRWNKNKVKAINHWRIWGQSINEKNIQ